MEALGIVENIRSHCKTNSSTWKTPRMQCRLLMRRYGVDLAFSPMTMADAFLHSPEARVADFNTLPLGHHTFGIECKSVLSTGVHRMLVGNRVGVGLTRSTINSFAPI